jgi:hypothetical protein
MKKLMTIAVLGLVVSGHVFAAGSTIQNSTISNDAIVTGSQNTALGLLGNAEANQASVKIKGSTVQNSTISNKAVVTGSQNTALGLLGNAKANQGSVDIE